MTIAEAQAARDAALQAYTRAERRPKHAPWRTLWLVRSRVAYWRAEFWLSKAKEAK